jgi:hypothetical protein
MPYQQRLTWDGVALHAGGLPGYPESHGCVHLPSKFAEELFGASHMGMTVVVVDGRTAPVDVVHPAALAPVDASTGAAEIQARLQAGEKWRWQPEKAPEGPVSIVASVADQRVIVLRNGVEIGRSRIVITDADQPIGTHAFIVKAGSGAGESAILKGAPARNWMAVAVPGYADDAGAGLSAVVGGRMHLPQDFARQLYTLLEPGTTLLVMDAPVLAQNTSERITVMGAGVPN